MRTFRVLLGGWLIGGAAIVLLSLGDIVARPAESSVPAVKASTSLLQPAAAMRSGLLIPVRGITANQLRDTFTQARSGGRSHGAMDILAPRGTEIVAAVDGTIRKLFTSKAGGLSIYQFDEQE
ncbi:MAG TPA: M23 family peptidase, partial [Thermoanaerobaculia bacterium]|nr:M23 family peptidase [Thermoanaerobaculia bacterium]